jgi:hypothetical protein
MIRHTPPSYGFCPWCGGVLETRRLMGNDHLICMECGRVLHVNPGVGVAVVVRQGQEILWGRRRGGSSAVASGI